MSETIFSKIIRKEIPANIVFENDRVLAFKDINPVAPVHILIIPKEVIPRVTNLDSNRHSSIVAELFEVANLIAEDIGIKEDGFRLVINCGRDGGQEVEHLHLHLIAGRKLTWPPG